jgi:hypothetical protein
VVDVELPVAAVHGGFGALPGGAAARQLGVVHVQVQLARGHVERDQVAVLHQRQRAAGGGLGRGVQHHGAVGGAAHARVADAHHVGDALRSTLGGSGMLPTSAMPG